MDDPILIIAEIGSVHNGDLKLAKELIDKAAACGVDSVKFQTHIAEAETTKDAPSPAYFKDESRFDYFKRTGFELEEWKQLKEHCDKNSVEFMSSAFSEEAVDLLEEVGMKRHKIPSGEVTNLPMLEKIAKLGKPILLSSGMSSWEELDKAVETIKPHTDQLSVMQCTSEYPCPPETIGLNIIVEMRNRYDLPVGFSDHSLTNYAAFASVMLGISSLEKHFTLSRDMYGSDAKHSLTPEEFTDLVNGVRAIEAMRNNPVDMDEVGKYQEMKDIFQKSVVTIDPIPAGTVITREMLGIKKPGTGIPAAEIDSVVGKITARDIEEDQVLQNEDVQ